jgi:hypothetical protein
MTPMGSCTSFWRALEFGTRSVVIRNTDLSELNSSKFRPACEATVAPAVVLPWVVAAVTGVPPAAVAVGL